MSPSGPSMQTSRVAHRADPYRLDSCFASSIATTTQGMLGVLRARPGREQRPMVAKRSRSISLRPDLSPNALPGSNGFVCAHPWQDRSPPHPDLVGTAELSSCLERAHAEAPFRAGEPCAGPSRSRNRRVLSQSQKSPSVPRGAPCGRRTLSAEDVLGRSRQYLKYNLKLTHNGHTTIPPVSPRPSCVLSARFAHLSAQPRPWCQIRPRSSVLVTCTSGCGTFQSAPGPAASKVSRSRHRIQLARAVATQQLNRNLSLDIAHSAASSRSIQHQVATLLRARGAGGLARQPASTYRPLPPPQETGAQHGPAW